MLNSEFFQKLKLVDPECFEAGGVAMPRSIQRNQFKLLEIRRIQHFDRGEEMDPEFASSWKGGNFPIRTVFFPLN